MGEAELLAGARGGDGAAFDQLVAGYRGELTAHCYRMLGSRQDAEDAVQESLLGVWRGLAGFEGRSSLRTGCTGSPPSRACGRAGGGCCRRTTARRGATTADLGETRPDDVPADEPGPADRVVRREGVELAFVAALQRLPGTQRAVLILREVLEYPAAEVARILDTTRLP